MELCDILSNDYSDHNIVYLKSGSITVKQLNVAQLGRFQIFPNENLPEKFNWSSTLRTRSILKKINDNKNQLIKLGKRLLIIIDQDLPLNIKNDKIEIESHLIMNELIKLGFDIKSFKMIPLKLFNPKASADQLHTNPDIYIKGPTYVLENDDSFSKRMASCFEIMFKNKPDIVCAQEIEDGEVDNINFTNIFSNFTNMYPNYLSIKHNINYYATMTCIYFNKDLFQDVSDKYDKYISKLLDQLKFFTDSSLKKIICCLKYVKTNEIFTIINIHADYPKANKIEPWYILRKILDENLNMIVCGDFNLQVKNKSYFCDAFVDFNGIYTICQTPESNDIGNPTYDLIIAN